ncbi:hypothetical protein R6U77_14695 [Lysinibacillus louembei]|uniref:Uncharacterized protein n=1 Tax=Lysinibacillus louembei TaxID=1470088 RepID=A0ABZ0RV93_9BACI|nr:hypothetical protein [Lysinibacillus louembei]WPK11126.1 hypothetical protein R6U77_14695 [Lysinibacillus louembei]
MTDRELLELLVHKVTGMEGSIQDLKTEMQEVKADVQSLKTEMQEVKADVQSLKIEMQEVKADVQNLKAEQQKTNARLDGIEAKLHIVYEQTGRLTEYHAETMMRFEQVATKDDLEYFAQKIAEHDRDIFYLKKRA